MIDRLRQLSEPRLRQQAGIEKSQTPVERDILIQWVRNCFFQRLSVCTSVGYDSSLRDVNIIQLVCCTESLVSVISDHQAEVALFGEKHIMLRI